MMATSRTRSAKWSDLKARLTDLDRAGLIALLRDLHAASRDNQVFLHTRFGLVDDVLGPYKATVDRWLSPDVLKNQDISITKAKKAISDYRKAVGEPQGLAELMVYFCERGMGFCVQYAPDDEPLLDALVRMYAQALVAIKAVAEDQRAALIERLEDLCPIAHRIGDDIEDELTSLLDRHGFDDRP